MPKMPLVFQKFATFLIMTNSINKKHKAKRIKAGEYLYRGFKLYCVGYYDAEHKYCWEAEDKDGSCFAQAYSLKDCKLFVDIELDGI